MNFMSAYVLSKSRSMHVHMYVIEKRNYDTNHRLRASSNYTNCNAVCEYLLELWFQETLNRWSCFWEKHPRSSYLHRYRITVFKVYTFTNC